MAPRAGHEDQSAVAVTPTVSRSGFHQPLDLGYLYEQLRPQEKAGISARGLGLRRPLKSVLQD
jgi:hypothetical protein